MDSRTQERVEQWDSRPFSGGYDGLSDLADDEFSGAVTVGHTWLFMLNGRIVGIVDGEIEDFDGASGTIYQAPHPSLPLLSAMEEQGGETRAKYYTNETPLQEVDRTLQDGSFTGYIELSENVLSGDYYAVYYGGRRMAAAYIGSAERLLTGDEAFERADDEVGIYEVIDIDLDVTDVPGANPNPDSTSGSAAASEPDGDAGAASAASSDASVEPPGSSSGVDPIDISGGESVTIESDDDVGGTATGAESTLESDEPSGITAAYDEDDAEPTSPGITEAESSGPSADAAGTDSGIDAEPATGADAGSGVEVAPDTGTDAPSGDDSGATIESEAGADVDAGSSTGSGPDPAEVEAAAEQLGQNGISWTGDDASDGDGDGEAAATETGADAESSGSSATAGIESGARTDLESEPESEPESQLEERFEEEEQWRETRRIPSIDPDHTTPDEDESSQPAESSATSTGTGQRSTAAKSDRRAESGDSRSADQSSRAARGSGQQRAESKSTSSPSTATSDSGSATSASSGRGDSQRIEQLADRIERLESEREDLVSERDRLREKNRKLSATVDRLESRIEGLEAKLKRARAGDGGGGSVSAATELSPDRALSGTNLFVRYDSKSQPTLERAHDGDADREEVAANLRLEHHTEFDANDVAVDGTPYEEYLTSTMAYRFVEWLTEMALYEIRDTGHANGLADLYDAIPRIDRAELDATISLADDDTEDVPDQVTFDVVAFDKRGNPLVLATLNDSRQPVTEDTLADLEATASAVKANYPDLAASMAVTSSYFEPGALEVTEEATSGGILSRGSKLSYVNFSRKQGYHLCLVESRSEGFHMNVPEL